MAVLKIGDGLRHIDHHCRCAGDPAATTVDDPARRGRVNRARHRAPRGEDNDEMGVLIETPEQILGLDDRGFSTVMQRT